MSSSIEELTKEAQTLYEKTFSSSDDDSKIICVMAPGRVNLIGEHVDYTGGFVLPIAISFATVVYGSFTTTTPNNNGTGGTCQIISSNTKEDKVFTFETSDPSKLQPVDPKSPDEWSNFIMGVFMEYAPLLPTTFTSCNIRAAFAGNVPLGSGLSSSAALEVSFATFLEACAMTTEQQQADGVDNNDDTSKKQRAIDRAVKCQHSSNTFVGVPCGIMDQFVSSAGLEGCALLIDCESNDYVPVRMGASPTKEEAVIVIANSNVKHSHSTGEYPIRVQQCKDATEALQKVDGNISSLRHATMKHLDQAKDYMTDLIYLRAKHVISENDRTQAAKEKLEAGDFAGFGVLMNGSHASMRDDYEVSCEEIDYLVSKAQTFAGVYGSRLTGGGFGGCTVTLVQKDNADALIRHLKEVYNAKYGKDCDCFVTTPSRGAGVLFVKKC